MPSRLRSVLPLAVALALAVGVLTVESAPAQGRPADTSVAPEGKPVEVLRQETPPKLIVLVVVDQLRADLLERFDPAFTKGLRRLREEGFRFTNATHDHSATYTAPGHATIATGTEPYKHGIVSNAWIQLGEQGWLPVENVLTGDYPLVDDPSLWGASPHVLERDGLADWLQAEYPEAKVVSVSGKPRSAVLMAAWSEASVYWFENGLGRWVTSTHYADRYPEWLEAFNGKRMPQVMTDSVWALAVPETFHSLARADRADYEGDGVNTTFPHRYSDSEWLYERGRFSDWWAETPFLDEATRLIAQVAVEAEGLGTDEIPDLLAISFSQTDRVGHAYGPLSLEQLDNLYRLDHEIGELMAWLDGTVGAGEYDLLLTSDHGTLDNPEAIVENGGWSLRLPQDSIVGLQRVLSGVVRDADISDLDEVARALAAAAPQLSWIEQGWANVDIPDIRATADSFSVLLKRSSFPGRRPGLLRNYGVELRYTENTLLPRSRGTTHGSPYHYDRHVPFILFGRDVPPGISEEPVSTADVAPTLAHRAGIPYPGDLDGVARGAGEGAGN